MSRADQPASLRLANGLELRTRPVSGRSTAAVALWWHAGRLHEQPDEAGAAHLIEHLVLEALPAGRCARWGGAVNGQSGREWTVWHALLPAESAPEFLGTLARALLAPLPPASRLERECRVLAAETGGAAARDLWEHCALRTAFGTHPVARPLAVAAHPDRERLAAFRARLLCGSRLRITAAGGLDPEALAAALRPLESLPAGSAEAPEPSVPALPARPGRHRIAAGTGALWLLPFPAGDAAAVAVLAPLLADPVLGALPRVLRDTREPLYGLHSEVEFCAGIGLWWLWAEDVGAAAALEAALARRLAAGFAPAELARARAWQRARRVLAGEDLLGCLEELAGVRPAPPARLPSASALARTLAACWERRCLVLGS